MVKNVYISTGQKQVMYTLWEENIVERPNPPVTEPSRIPILPAFIHYNYIKNLSMDEATAIKEATEYAKEHDGNFTGISDSPQYKRATFFEAFGIHFTQRRKQGKTFFMATSPTNEFWDAWRTKKEDMRKAGFSVSKFYDKRKRIEEWYVFYRPQEV